MKIFILSTPRTRSSYFLDILCQQHNIENYYESYNDIQKQADSISLFKDPKIVFEKYKKICKKYTEELHKKSNFGIKFFPAFAVNYVKMRPNILEEQSRSETYSCIFDKDDILDLEEYFNISKYDKIYMLYRKNIVDYLASFMHGMRVHEQINQGQYSRGMTFTSNDAYLINYFQPKNKLQYSTELIKRGLREMILLESYGKYFIHKNIPFTKLEYEDIPVYVKDNFPNIESKYIESNFDYKNFTNYENLKEDIYKFIDQIRIQVDITHLLK